MNLSMKWLADYVDVGNITPHEFSEAMTMSGSKVEGWEREGAEIKNVVVGPGRRDRPPPDSDHMFVTQVDVGAGAPVQIVTGAQNVHEGDLVPVARHNRRPARRRAHHQGQAPRCRLRGMLAPTRSWANPSTTCPASLPTASDFER